MDMERLAEIFEAVKVLPLRPTDYVVFRASRYLPQQAREYVKRHLQDAFGADRKILILENGDDIEIVRPES